MGVPVRDGCAWFGGGIPIPLCPNLATGSTMPPEGYRPAYAGPYGGDFDQRDARAGSRIHPRVMVPGALVFFADPHAAISDGNICGTGAVVRLPSRPFNAQAIARPRESVAEQQVGGARQGRKTTATTLNPICRAPRVFTSAAGPRARLP